MSPRILITGSRDWADRNTINTVLSRTWWQLGRDFNTVLVHGAARGADTIAAELWAEQGLPTEAHPADWRAWGKRAGTLRNELMVDLGADICLAFPMSGSVGTRHCMRIAEAAGIPVKSFEPRH